MILIITWAAIISFAIIMYVLLDGFDLGIGILFPFIRDEHSRDIMISTVAPVWDGNETWLVMGGASLYAAFPQAYSVLLPTLYMPIMIMLAALIFRGITFEFRFKSTTYRYLWDICFACGSTLAALAQGIILGTFVIGYGSSIPDVYTPYHWLTPFSLMTGIAVVCGYALLGSTWLIMRTTAELQQKMYLVAKLLLPVLALFLLIVSLWSPWVDSYIMARWFSLPNLYYLMPLPILTAIAIFFGFYALQKQFEIIPFVMAIILFVFSYIGFCISSYPYIIPHVVTVWDAAAPPSTLKFILVGAAILLPILIAYTIYSYHVFRGKVTVVEHY